MKRRNSDCETKGRGAHLQIFDGSLAWIASAEVESCDASQDHSLVRILKVASHIQTPYCDFLGQSFSVSAAE